MASIHANLLEQKEFLHKKTVELPQGMFGRLTCPLVRYLATPIWLPSLVLTFKRTATVEFTRVIFARSVLNLKFVARIENVLCPTVNLYFSGRQSEALGTSRNNPVAETTINRQSKQGTLVLKQ